MTPGVWRRGHRCFLFVEGLGGVAGNFVECRNTGSSKGDRARLPIFGCGSFAGSRCGPSFELSIVYVLSSGEFRLSGKWKVSAK